MNSLDHVKVDAVSPSQIFRCAWEVCGATFRKEWRLKEHQHVHTGERPLVCPVSGCERRFAKTSRLSRHKLHHTGQKRFRCSVGGCCTSFFTPAELKRHVTRAHGEGHFKCHYAGCTMMFRKRKAYKMHLVVHGLTPVFKCKAKGCTATFETSVACKAHEKTHKGKVGVVPGCQVVEHTWGKLIKHIQEHEVAYTCKECPKAFRKRAALRRHKRTHASQKPVLHCPKQDCQAYFTTTFNLQHHIRKVHLQLLKYHCNYPECSRAFAMHTSWNRHWCTTWSSFELQKNQQASKSWQKRLEGRKQPPLMEENLSNLFALRMRLPRRLTLEANLTNLFNERQIPHNVEPEVNLCDLFSLKVEHPQDVPLTH
ncbi:P43 5S RNA-binding protein-like [Arapaima gigas]